MRATQRSRPAAGILAVLASPQLGRRALIVAVNLLVASVVMSLPFLASAASGSAPRSAFSASAVGSTSLAPADGAPQVSRAAPAARGGTIAAGRNPVTVQAQGVRPIGEYVLSASDTLWSIANFYGLSAEAIAFANGIMICRPTCR